MEEAVQSAKNVLEILNGTEKTETSALISSLKTITECQEELGKHRIDKFRRDLEREYELGDGTENLEEILKHFSDFFTNKQKILRKVVNPAIENSLYIPHENHAQLVESFTILTRLCNDQDLIKKNEEWIKNQDWQKSTEELELMKANLLRLEGLVASNSNFEDLEAVVSEK